jgi:predicted TIM-barrel fold metal-dependent hydrolase
MRAAALALCVVATTGACRCGAPYQKGEPRRVIDVHTHIGYGVGGLAVEIFDGAGIEVAANLSGLPTGPTLDAFLDEARSVSASPPGVEILVFAGVDWRRVGDDDFGALAAEGLRRAVTRGARGLKISKGLGLGVRRPDGTLLRVDDPILDPLWRAAGDLGVPVAIHTGDPVAFFQPVTDANPRIEELRAHPSWSFYGGDYPSHDELLAARDRVVARHPRTTFVGVHVGGYPENLTAVAASLRAHPNLWIDLAARIPEIGRQEADPVRAFFEEFQDRILFGTDLQIGPRAIVLGSRGEGEWPTPEDAVRYYEVHWRYLETTDRDFAHMTPIQGRWTISGIGLPRRILEKVYRENARRLLQL